MTTDPANPAVDDARGQAEDLVAALQKFLRWQDELPAMMEQARRDEELQKATALENAALRAELADLKGRVCYQEGRGCLIDDTVKQFSDSAGDPHHD